MLPPEEDEDGLPRYVVGLMFASDSAMLASFGTASIWPVYLMYGNESKYRRGRTSLNLFEEVAYLQKVSLSRIAYDPRSLMPALGL